MSSIFLFDCEVFAYDWLFVFKNIETGEKTIVHNDNEAVKQFMALNGILGGFNNKHYDNHILKAVLCDADPVMVKEINDFIIVHGHNGWEHPWLQQYKVFFDSFDLMDDCQMGLSLKAIEAHLGMDIRETTVDFSIDHPLSPEELDEVIQYCCHDVDATEQLFIMRKAYLRTKMTLGREKNIPDARALYMTNAKLTAAYLEAEAQAHYDEREYTYPSTLKKEYIPPEVFQFFERLHDMSIPDDVVFKEKLDLEVGGCPCTIAYGGIHGAIPSYTEEATENRTIRNKDVASYYPHQMTLNGYCSRNIPSPEVFAAALDRRVAAKRAGNKALNQALKLVLNTTYGAMLNAYNALYDPLMGRSVCISGQLQLLELAEHLIQECPTLKIIQLNTDGIMVSLDNTDEAQYQEITQEWQERTGFELEEDFIQKIVQKDVNNYVEIPVGAKSSADWKIKGGVLVRGAVTNADVDFEAMGYPWVENLNGSAFNINTNALVVARAVRDYLGAGIPVEKTIMECDRLMDFQLIAKAGSKYSGAYHLVDGEKVPVQKVNRVYATPFTVENGCRYGTIYKTHALRGSDMKIGGLPEHCIIDNDNHLTLDVVDRQWYIRLAKDYVNDFLGREGIKRNTRRVNNLKKKAVAALEVEA